MNAFAVDLHIHSCLSPCAEDDMTPCNIAGMGYLNGLRIMALTDHNTAKNCPAFTPPVGNTASCPCRAWS